MPVKPGDCSPCRLNGHVCTADSSSLSCCPPVLHLYWALHSEILGCDEHFQENRDINKNGANKSSRVVMDKQSESSPAALKEASAALYSREHSPNWFQRKLYEHANQIWIHLRCCGFN